jgi:hypothetical protein
MGTQFIQSENTAPYPQQVFNTCNIVVVGGPYEDHKGIFKMSGSAQKYSRVATLTSNLNPGWSPRIYSVRFWNVMTRILYIQKHLKVFGIPRRRNSPEM